MPEPSPSSLLGSTAWGVLAVCVTVVVYVLLLGWNAKMELSPEEPGAVGTECTGPHEPRQVVMLAFVLALMVILGAWFRHEYVVPAACVTTLTLLFTVDALTVDDPCSDNSLLAVGVLLLLVGSTVAATVLAVITTAIRDRRLAR